MTTDTRELIAVFGGGVLGALSRAGIDGVLGPSAAAWPWATFVVNVLGCFLLGYFATRLQERLPLSAYRRPLLGTGLCGALTTFSTFQLELVRLVEHSHLALAIAYCGASLGAGFLAVTVATSIVRRSRFAQ